MSGRGHRRRGHKEGAGTPRRCSRRESFHRLYAPVLRLLGLPAVKRLRPLAVLVLIAGLVAGVYWAGQSRSDEQGVSGTIEADEVRVASRYGGRVQSVHFREGDLLQAGDVIVRLEAAELLARRERAAARLEELEAGPRPAEIAAASNEWRSLEAQLDFARAEERRVRELYQQRTVSATERDQAESRARALERSVAAARERYELLVEGTRPERLAQARAELAELEALVRETVVMAPTSCVLETLHVKVGDVVAPNREVATLLLADSLWVRVYVPGTWLGHLAVGHPVKVRVDAWPQQEWQGTIEQIQRAAEFTPRNVQTRAERIRQVFGVKVRLPSADGRLRAGMSAEVFFAGVPGPPEARVWLRKP